MKMYDYKLQSLEVLWHSGNKAVNGENKANPSNQKKSVYLIQYNE